MNTKTENKFRWRFLFKFLPYILAVLGVITPMIWDLYKTKTALEVRNIASTTLVESPREVVGLQIVYGTKKIQRLSKCSFEIVNTGRSPILAKDVVGPFVIQFSTTTEILSIIVEEMTPPNLNATVTKLNNNSIGINFPLLNSKDRFRFNVLSAGADPIFDVNARIVGIRQIMISKNVSQKLQHQPQTPFSQHPMIDIAALLAFIIAINAFIEHGRETLLSILANNGILSFGSAKSKDEVVAKLETIFKVLSLDAQQQCYRTIHGISKTDFDSGKAQQNLSDMIMEIATQTQGMIYAAWIFVAIGIVGFWYAY